MSKPAGTVRLRRLGGELRRLRDLAHLTQEDVVEAIGINRSTLIRIETARTRPQRRTLTALLDLYAVGDQTREELFGLLVNAAETEWVRSLKGTLPAPYGAYIGLESEASGLQAFEPLLVPGLLQTPEYAYAQARAALPQASKADVETRVTARMARQEAFTKRGTPLWVILTEAALRYQIGGRAVTCAQLARLLEVENAPDITLQVIPFRAGGHPSMGSSFALLDFPDRNPPVVYLENPAGDLFLEDPADVNTYTVIYAHLRATALGPTETVRFIARIISDIQAEGMDIDPRDDPRTSFDVEEEQA